MNNEQWALVDYDRWQVGVLPHLRESDPIVTSYDEAIRVAQAMYTRYEKEAPYGFAMVGVWLLPKEGNILPPVVAAIIDGNMLVQPEAHDETD